MRCIDFVNVYKVKTKNKPDLKDEERIKIVSDIIHPLKYISFKHKQELILDVLINTIKIENDKLFYNSCDKYYKFITTLLSRYTDLRDCEENYDILCSNDVLNYTIGALGTEYEICLGIMNMYMDDLEHGRIKLEKL